MFVVKVPAINGLGKTSGCEKAGNAVIEALKEIYGNERGATIDARLLDLEEIHVDNGNIEEAGKLIYKNSLEIFGTRPKTIFIGGDHSISYNTTKAFMDYCKNSEKEPCLIIFDAHPDCMSTFEEIPGGGGIKTPTHEEWLRTLIEDGFPTENIFLVGVRNQAPEETAFLKQSGVKIMKMGQLLENLDDCADILLEFSNGKELYVSVDIDSVDPAFAPATGYIEPGGLTSRQLIYVLQRLTRAKNLKAIDIVEINPDKEGAKITVQLGAKILSEFL